MDNGRDAARTVLCVDVGNSDTNLGLFVGGELEATWKVTTTERMTADEARTHSMSITFSLVLPSSLSSPLSPSLRPSIM